MELVQAVVQEELVYQDQQVVRDHREPQDHQVYKVYQVVLDRLEDQDQQGSLVSRVLRVQRVR